MLGLIWCGGKGGKGGKGGVSYCFCGVEVLLGGGAEWMRSSTVRTSVALVGGC